MSQKDKPDVPVDKRLEGMATEAETLLQSLEGGSHPNHPLSSNLKVKRTGLSRRSNQSNWLFTGVLAVPFLVIGVGFVVLAGSGSGGPPTVQVPQNALTKPFGDTPNRPLSVASGFDDVVTVGLLHSLTGTMAISESTLVDSEKMAITRSTPPAAEVAARSKIEYIVEDGASDWPPLREVQKLIDQDNVPVVFGGWTVAVGDVAGLRSKNAFLYYPFSMRVRSAQQHLLHRCNSEPAVGACTKFMYEKSPAAGKLLPRGFGLRLPPHVQHYHQRAAQVARREGSVRTTCPWVTEVAPIIARSRRPCPMAV